MVLNQIDSDLESSISKMIKEDEGLSDPENPDVKGEVWSVKAKVGLEVHKKYAS